MRKITNIEKDCFYLWIEKPKDPKESDTWDRVWDRVTNIRI